MEGPCPPPPLPPSTSYRGEPLLLDLVGGEEHPFKSVETDGGLAEVHFGPWTASSTAASRRSRPRRTTTRDADRPRHGCTMSTALIEQLRPHFARGWAVPNLADAASHPASSSLSLNSDRRGRTVLWC